jgi:hypothetical protein
MCGLMVNLCVDGESPPISRHFLNVCRSSYQCVILAPTKQIRESY